MIHSAEDSNHTREKLFISPLLVNCNEAELCELVVFWLEIEIGRGRMALLDAYFYWQYSKIWLLACSSVSTWKDIYYIISGEQAPEDFIVTVKLWHTSQQSSGIKTNEST